MIDKPILMFMYAGIVVLSGLILLVGGGYIQL